jgi:hypothetical protein
LTKCRKFPMLNTDNKLAPKGVSTWRILWL